MNKNFRSGSYHIFRFVPLLMLLGIYGLIPCACSDDETPEQQVRDFIAAGIQAAENRKAGELRDMIDDDYMDVKGNDKKSVSRVALGYFLRNRNIHLFSQINSIHFPKPEQADVQMYVAMTGKPVDSLDRVFSLRAELVRFDLKLVKRDGEWLLNNARWQRVRADELRNL